ncbi:patatin-like phospholipase family protein [Ramlibacter sp.]|uniref:patatin-like phospholipase family protein n=1 Tax=Ramlibacter sp. TaxID=1917967 RepID=UPI002C59404B|nr:patatin-like phospholipase family protein [Ramlibacter sp.]HWI81255.1 patatin-like phospholipase family protein [Ramlibacter sp.]
MPALRIHAGPLARRHIARHGLQPGDIGVVPGAAGGPKGLILGPLDRFLFGQWLPRSSRAVDLVGASIGAWRMAAACLGDPAAALQRLERDYIAQDYELAPGRKTPTADHVSERFGQSLHAFYGERVVEVLTHPRYRLHMVTARGRHVLGREHRLATPVGYLGAFLSNLVHRRAMGAWLERVVFSSPVGDQPAPLPFAIADYRTRQVLLTPRNFHAALQASCSIPFVLRAVHDIDGAPRGAYWDGGTTDYHLHLQYRAAGADGLVLYPHFQRAIVPGWLDKGLTWRHGATAFLDRTIVLAPDREWVGRLPNGKLPDRTDFARYGTDLRARIEAWTAAAAASRQLADEFAEWLERPDPARVEPL